MAISSINGILWDNLGSFNGTAKVNIASINGVDAPLTIDYFIDNFPGVTFAVSLRKLRSDYTGSCMRIRRASDNTEQDIGFINDDIDTAAINTFCTGSSCFIRTWYDQSVNENEAGISTTSLQPQIYGSNAVLTNGALFSSDYLTLTNPTELGISGSTLRSTFAVVRRNNNAFRFIFVAKPTSYSSGTVYIITSEFGVRVQDGNKLFTTSIPSSLELMSMIMTGSNVLNHNLRVNDTTISAITSASRTINTDIVSSHIGNDPTFSPSSPYDGNIKELIIFNSDQTSNVDAIEANINNYYSIY